MSSDDLSTLIQASARSKTGRIRGKNWTKEEDRALLEAARLHGNKWELVAKVAALAKRTPSQCQAHHSKLLRTFAGKDNAPSPPKNAISSPTAQQIQDGVAIKPPSPPEKKDATVKMAEAQEQLLADILQQNPTQGDKVEYCYTCNKLPATLECLSFVLLL